MGTNTVPSLLLKILHKTIGGIDMTITLAEFKKQVKGIKGKNKKVTPVEHSEYILSASSDGTYPNPSIIVVVPSYHKDFDIVLSRNKAFAYIVQSLDVLNNQNILKHVASVVGLNWLFTIDKEFVCTFTLKYDRTVSAAERDAFKSVQDLYSDYKELNNYYTDIVKSELNIELTKESLQQFKQYSVEKGYTALVSEKYSEYKKQFEHFIKTFGYNPYDYNLVL